MATIKDNLKSGYCDDVLSELAYMIQTVNELKVHAANTYGAGSEVARVHERHLNEIAEYLDWKLEILTKACPFEWKALDDSVQSIVSVNQPGQPESDFSGGYLGG